MNIQRICENLGKTGCYFLSILKHFDREYECVKWYEKAVGLKYMGPDCFMERPDLVAGLLSPKKFTVRKEGPEYKVGPREWEVLCYEWKPAPMQTLNHFVLPDYDPLGESNTIKFGKVVSKRIFKEVG